MSMTVIKRPTVAQTEDIMRVFRDVFFEDDSTPENWEACKERWMRHYPKLVERLDAIGICFSGR